MSLGSQQARQCPSSYLLMVPPESFSESNELSTLQKRHFHKHYLLNLKEALWFQCNGNWKTVRLHSLFISIKLKVFHNTHSVITRGPELHFLFFFLNIILWDKHKMSTDKYICVDIFGIADGVLCILIQGAA